LISSSRGSTDLAGAHRIARPVRSPNRMSRPTWQVLSNPPIERHPIDGPRDHNAQTW